MTPFFQFPLIWLRTAGYKHNAARAINLDLAPDVCKLNNAVDKSLSSG